MAKNTSVSLGDHFAAFVTAKVKEGRYGSASDVLRAGLRLLEDQEARLDALRTALEDGESSGAPQTFDLDDFLSDMHASHPDRA